MSLIIILLELITKAFELFCILNIEYTRIKFFNLQLMGCGPQLIANNTVTEPQQNS